MVRTCNRGCRKLSNGTSPRGLTSLARRRSACVGANTPRRQAGHALSARVHTSGWSSGTQCRAMNLLKGRTGQLRKLKRLHLRIRRWRHCKPCPTQPFLRAPIGQIVTMTTTGPIGTIMRRPRQELQKRAPARKWLSAWLLLTKPSRRLGQQTTMRKRSSTVFERSMPTSSTASINCYSSLKPSWMNWRPAFGSSGSGGRAQSVPGVVRHQNG